MRKSRLTKLIASTLVAISVLALNSKGVNAEWKQDATGKWYAEGNSWATGWKQIDGKWYYFDNNGYMKYGWIQEGSNWYYLMNVTGAMATNITVDTHIIDSNGVWIGDTTNNTNVATTNSNKIRNSHKIHNCDEKYIMTIYYNKNTLGIDSYCSVLNNMGWYGEKKSEKMKDFDYFIIDIRDYGYSSSMDVNGLVLKYKVGADSNGEPILVRK
ncbi:hypothetical protein [Clostridium beijerinckii]|uniref:hypothetical protein n=1 Tax=Clostridium beijerinckii TaxID=1520 RepID=UPI00098C3D9C|nr:hypothetical protein [Clostridium beijerinckii]NRT79446.1 glucan-binding YG repeat protein [Clostridium beijerinckii]OOM41544.1 autolysin [Clostridium beijerinckii]